MKRVISWLLAAVLAAMLAVPAGAVYMDIPAGSALSGEVQKAVQYGLMEGYSASRFGYGDPMTRAQFVTVLDRMLGWSHGDETLMGHITPAMEVDPPSRNTEKSVSSAYYTAIDHGAERDVVDRDVPFRPNDSIIRGEMAEMLVRALGLKSAAALAERQSTLPFSDVTNRQGYIAVAYAIGMTNGTSASTFSPGRTATRAQAAAMLVRIHEKLSQKTGSVHGFYASGSYGQLPLSNYVDAVSVGWSRMTWDGERARLATTSAGGNEYFIPTGYQEVADYLAEGRTRLHLNVYMDGGAPRELLASPEGRTQAVSEIVNELTVSYRQLGRNPYNGVTVDFEGLRAASRDEFTAFLTELGREVHGMGKTLYVCVSPVLLSGPYYDGYDYRAIADLADQVILMAYDYDARDLSGFEGTEYYKNITPAPIDQVFMSLEAIASQVRDPGKIALGFSSKNIAWQIEADQRLVSGKPLYPSNETLYKRLEQPDTIHGWSDSYQTSYAIYTTEDGRRYFAWYDNSNSVQVKLNAAKLLGITDVSIWRFGIVPTMAGFNFNWMNLLTS